MKYKKKYADRPTAVRYRAAKRWLTNAEKRQKRIGKTFNKRREELKQELLQKYPQLGRFNLKRWTLSALKRRVRRYSGGAS